jgi:hexosaminidase
MRIQRIPLLISSIVLLGCSHQPVSNEADPKMNIIPKPQSVEILPGAFQLSDQLNLQVTGDLQNAGFFTDLLQSWIPGLDANPKKDADIELKLDPNADLPEEAYELVISPSKIFISAKSDPGLFYGLQSLRQLLPVEIEKGILPSGTRLAAMKIQDQPRFQWRGMHLDVSRHFFPKEFVKQYIDMIALHKMNVFHWHLTDDNGWRLEIKKYPKLTEICAWRVDREHEDWRKWSPIKEGEKSTYGGFYTQEEVREIVAYASERQITIVPEIEMPGHSSELFAAYPEWSCRGEYLPVRPGSYWPNKDILCAGNDEVFTFLEDVIDEVVELFPSKYIHIGGDEATKTYWETCPKCQARIQAEGLANEHELQSWFIRKMERYILAKGRQIIGWDEILEGGLAPQAAVMSWRGEKGGIAAAKAGHDVVMTPYSHVYFDYYQGDPETEPQAIGGYTPLKRVYGYEPIPKELSAEEAKYVLGSQANLWTEFVKTPDHAEYMVLPRMTALSEVVWSKPEQRDWVDFRTRLSSLLPRFEILGWQTSPGSFMVEIQPGRSETDGLILVDLVSEQIFHDLRYTMDGSEPHASSPIYTQTIRLDRDATIQAALFDGAQRAGRITRRDFAFHQALDGSTSYKMTYSQWYRGGGDAGLVDGILGTENHKDGTWQGFEGNDLELTIDLGEERSIFKVEMNFLQNSNSWIFMPQFLEAKISQDGTNWKTVSKALNEVPVTDESVGIHRLTAGFATQQARYVKVFVKNLGECPEGHPGAGGKSWLFTDEVIVR